MKRARPADAPEPATPELAESTAAPENSPDAADHPFGGDLAERVARAVELLEAIDGDRGVLAHIDQPTRKRLLIAAGRVSRPGRNAMRAQARAMRRVAKRKRRRADERILSTTGIRVTRSQPTFPTPSPALPAGQPEPTRRVIAPRNCYQCKHDFHELHFFYDALCPECADLNWRKRTQSADLSGRVALVTGGRVKIGYQTAIKLLRAGGRVIVTTRFPRDAATRFATEADFADWADRLEIHGLDLRHTPSVEAFARGLCHRHHRLDFVINNACQTVRRPTGYYRHLMDAETQAANDLPAAVRAVLGPSPEPAALQRGRWAIANSAELSQVPLLPQDLAAGGHIFPPGSFDADGQQIDLRDKNSWRLALAEVPTVELLEVHLVNAVAPFVLCARLKPLMLRDTGRDKHIVNVSAMEGQFYRRFKTDKHPHTNMAKAALNMLTRTSAADYVEHGIHMNSVDTGWVTDEDPLAIAARKREEHGFHPPLDIVDGAARICDPIFDGLLTGDHAWGKFFKDYRETRW